MIPHRAFCFLRHGETDWNLARKMMGQTDIPLNATGRAQAERARAVVESGGFKAIAASSLSRAWETAAIVNAELGLTMTPVDDLREVDVGPFVGQSDPDWMRRWHAGEPMAGVESYAGFTARVARGLARALTLDHPVLVVAHGGVFRAIESLLGHAGKTDVPNCCLARFDPPTGPEAGAGSPWRIQLA